MKNFSKNKRLIKKAYIKKVNLSGTSEDVTFIFDSHKTIRLSLSKEGSIFIKMPTWCSEAQAEDFILKKTSWILKKKKDFENIVPHREDIFYYLGRPFNHCVKEGKEHIEFNRGILRIQVPEKKLERIEKILKVWEKELAQNILAKRFARIWLKYSVQGTPFHGLATPNLKIRMLSRRFGSCTSEGEITLAVRLIRYPLVYIDYVIIHELCHLKVMSHDKRFYALMEKCLPRVKNYKNNFRKWRLLHGNI